MPGSLRSERIHQFQEAKHPLRSDNSAVVCLTGSEVELMRCSFLALFLLLIQPVERIVMVEMSVERRWDSNMRRHIQFMDRDNMCFLPGK